MTWEDAADLAVLLALASVPLSTVLLAILLAVVRRELAHLAVAQDATTEAVNEGARDLHGVLWETGQDVAAVRDEVAPPADGYVPATARRRAREQPGNQGEHPGSIQ